MTPRLMDNAWKHVDQIAIVDAGVEYSYGDLFNSSDQFAAELLDGKSDLNEVRIAFLVPPGFQYVVTQWAIWRAGGIAVPLGLMYPPAELEYVLDDTQAETIVVSDECRELIEGISGSRTVRIVGQASQAAKSEWEDASLLAWEACPTECSRRAMILYTSGTTSKPKGVVTTHANTQAQVDALVEAWQWSADDHILHVLPLHHVHGIINALWCAMSVGAKCEFLHPFNAETIWHRFADGDLTLFMAVPTIYAKLIAAWDAMPSDQQQRCSDGCRRMRLMVSGSAALPVSILKKWKSITGHVLLERYGMTEIGMALSNPYDGERAPGHVGRPLSNIEVRRVDESGHAIETDGVAGEIEVRGQTVFREYWRKPESTRDAFRNGWFRTGDVAIVRNGVYRILGRNSVDIIKTGGYKVSSLEIEEVLRSHDAINECAVVGVDDEEWGERVCACVVCHDGAELKLDPLRVWAKERLAQYKVPSRLLVVERLPRNAMGKVQKLAVVELLESEDKLNMSNERVTKLQLE